MSQKSKRNMKRFSSLARENRPKKIQRGKRDVSNGNIHTPIKLVLIINN